MRLNKNVSTFIGCEADFDDASIVLIGAPFDSTTSYRPGTRFASSAIRKESFGLEIYSPYQDKVLDTALVCDAGDLDLPFGNASRALDVIEEASEEILSADKLPFLIGGEHLVTLGNFRAVFKKYPDVHIVHFDAHTDLRDDYMGEKLSHATVIRRCHDYVGDHKIYQFGIRSGEKAEFEFAKKHLIQEKFTANTVDAIVDLLSDKPVYLTVDLDVLDPSQLPGTGTPEAGGLTFDSLRCALMKVTNLNIVGLDVNELNPMLDPSGASTALACKLIRELLIALQK
jgi:agmatinase